MRLRFRSSSALFLLALSALVIPSSASAHPGHLHESAPVKSAPPRKAASPATAIGAVVPLFVRPDKQGASASSWALRQHIGQNAVVLLFPATGTASLDAASRQSLEEVSRDLRFRGMATALVQGSTARLAAAPRYSAAIPKHVASAPAVPALSLLTDDTGSLRRLFRLDPKATALVSIDRSGFLRRVQILHEAGGQGSARGRTDSLVKALEKTTDPTPTIAEGHAAPNFLVRDMNGRVQRLRDYRGRNLLLTFFPRCFTGGCVSHLSSLRDYKAELDATNTSVLAVSVDAADGPKGQKAFASNLKLNFPLIPDTGRNLSILYGAAHSPDQLASRISILIDKAGMVRWIDRGIDVKTHGADVLAKIKSLSLNETTAP